MPIFRKETIPPEIEQTNGVALLITTEIPEALPTAVGVYAVPPATAPAGAVEVKAAVWPSLPTVTLTVWVLEL